MTISTPTLPGYIFRFAQREDLPAIHYMLECSDAVDHSGFVDNLEDMYNQFIDPWSSPETDYLLALTAEDQVAAMGRVFVNPSPQRERCCPPSAT